MGNNEKVKERSIVLHPLSDLSFACAPLFVNHLKRTFMHGTGKSGVKFHVLRDLVIRSLPTAPSPGPATFVMHCLEALLFVEPPYNEGLSHLLTSALSHLDPENRPSEDAALARKLAALLFCNSVAAIVQLEARIIVRLVVVFGIELKDVGEALNAQGVTEEATVEAAKSFVEPFIFNLIKGRAYHNAVALLKQFDLQECTSQDFMINMVNDGQPDLAALWAAYLGKDMICFLVQWCTDMGMFKQAYKFVERYQLQEDFPDACYLYRQSSLRKLVGKGLWDVAEDIANRDPQLPEYLVALALEVGDATRAQEICNRFQLKDIPLYPATQRDGADDSCFLKLTDFIPIEKIIWVDSSEGLAFASKYLNGVAVVGIDCEWKADWLKGSEPNKVAILQLATPELVFVFDIIILAQQEQDSLDKCMKTVFHSPNILKLGYAVHNDLERLLQSYKELECFHRCESVLDLQRVAGKACKGGLSGLAKVVLGRYMDKQMRMSDWEQRPLSTKQLHYAALDASILLPIFDNICSVSSASNTDVPQWFSDWKLHVMSFRPLPISKQHSGESRKKSAHLGQFSQKVTSSRSFMNVSVECCASHEDIVSATCELVGLPTPGLLKSELHNLTRAANLPSPLYKAVIIGPANASIYCCTVRVAGMDFSGCPALCKKDAEFVAAHAALAALLNVGHDFGRVCAEFHQLNQAIHQDKMCLLQHCCSSNADCCHVIVQEDPHFCMEPAHEQVAFYEKLWLSNTRGKGISVWPLKDRFEDAHACTFPANNLEHFATRKLAELDKNVLERKDDKKSLSLLLCNSRHQSESATDLVFFSPFNLRYFPMHGICWKHFSPALPTASNIQNFPIKVGPSSWRRFTSLSIHGQVCRHVRGNVGTLLGKVILPFVL